MPCQRASLAADARVHVGLRHALWKSHMPLLHSLLAGAVIALLALAAQARQAESLPGESFQHHDWLLVCDNTRTCRAAGYQADGEEPPVSLLFTRQAGPGTPVRGEVMLGHYDEPEASVLPGNGNELRLQINGADQGELPWAAGAVSGGLSDLQVAALLEALAGNARIELVAGPSRWRISDRGATAVLLKFDEYQERLETPGAMLRKGKAEESRVLPALPLPVVTAAPLSQQPLPSIDRDALLQALSENMGGDDCLSDTDVAPADAELGLFRLSPDKLLVSLLCWRAAYNEGYAYWVIDDLPPYSPQLVTISGSDFDDGQIHVSQKGRGLGDCWWSETWTWDGERFVQTRAAGTGMCRMVAAGGAWDLPRIVAEVRRAPSGSSP